MCNVDISMELGGGVGPSQRVDWEYEMDCQQ